MKIIIRAFEFPSLDWELHCFPDQATELLLMQVEQQIAIDLV